MRARAQAAATPRGGWRDGRNWLLAGVLLVVAGRVGYEFTGRGAAFWHGDLRTLWRDQAAFYAGVYPHGAVAGEAARARMLHTAYPPTSFLLFGPWLPPGLGWTATRGWFMGCQLAALGALATWAWRRGRAVDPRLGWLLGGSVLAMTGARADLLFGNVALIATALALGALVALERERAVGAAGAWLAAMVKPQVGWLFALALWRRRAWRAWLGAVGLLGASGAAACAWTGVSLAAALRVEAGEEVAKWGSWSPLNNLPVWLGAGGLSAHAALVTGALLALAGGAWAVTRPGLREDRLGQFAVLGLASRIGVYHNYCDDVLLVFALVWLGCRAWRGSRPDRAVWLALAGTAALPTGAIAAAGLKGVVLLVWTAAAAWIVRRAGAEREAQGAA